MDARYRALFRNCRSWKDRGVRSREYLRGSIRRLSWGDVPLEGNLSVTMIFRSFVIRPVYPILSKASGSSSSNEGNPGGEFDCRGVYKFNDGRMIYDCFPIQAESVERNKGG